MGCNILKCTCGSRAYFPQRFLMALLCFIGFVLCYSQRVALNLAITVMIPASTSPSKDCPNPKANQTSEDSTIEGGKITWDNDQMNLVLGSFYIGYFLAHVPAGVISDFFGARHVFGIGCVISALTTILTPLAAVHTHWWVVFLIRVVMGFGQSCALPAISTLYAKWIPREERSLIGGLSFAANAIGVILGNLLTGYMIHLLQNWPFSFYFWGGLGLFHYVIYNFYVFSDPESHPFITEREKLFLDEKISKSSKRLEIPWMGFVKDWACWGLVIGEIGHTLTVFTLITNIPVYMSKVLHYSLKENSVVSSLPYLGQWVSGIISGRIVDVCIKKVGIRTVTMRRITTTIGLPGACAFVVLAGLMGCNRTWVIVFFFVNLVLKGPVYVGIKVNHLDMSVNFAGIIMAFTNGAGAITGFLSSYLVKELTRQQTLKSWQLVFWIIFIITIVTDIFYVLTCTGERREWDVGPEEMDDYLKRKAQMEAERAEARARRAAA